jgi:hypothetical protein
MDANEKARADRIAFFESVAKDPSKLPAQVAVAQAEIDRIRMPRPPVADIVALLREKNAIIVHFSYHGKGPGEHLYPYDFENAIKHSDTTYLCASTIGPRDIALTHSVGWVGLVLKPKNDFSITKVTCGDGGTSSADHLYPSLDEMRESIDKRGTEEPYNQWTFQSSAILGLFAFEGAQVAAKRDLPMPHDPEGYVIAPVD